MRKPSWPPTHRIRPLWLVDAQIMALLAVALVFMMSACAERSPGRERDVPAIRLLALPPIGGESEPGHVGFGTVADIEIGEDGSVFVLDELSRVIHVFNEQGTLLRTFGRRGRGPGELERPAVLTWGPGGDLWVFDAANARFTVFDPQGRLVATYRSPDPELVYPWAISFSAAGLLYTVSSGIDLVNQEFRLMESEVADGEIRELRRIDLPFIEQPADFVHQGEGTVLVLPIPFSSLPVLRIGPDGHFWYANTREPWIRRRSLADGIEQTIGREFDPPKLTQPELQAVLERDRVFKELQRVAGPAVWAEFTRRIPDTRPHLDGFFFDDAANVWLIRSGGAGDDIRAMDVYDRSGSLIATASAALEPEPRPRVRGGLMAAVVKDELGVESIALYRILQ